MAFPTPYAPLLGSYVTAVAESALAHARRLVGGANVTLTDGGAGGTLSIAAAAGGFTPKLDLYFLAADFTVSAGGTTFTVDNGAGTWTAIVSTLGTYDGQHTFVIATSGLYVLSYNAQVSQGAGGNNNTSLNWDVGGTGMVVAGIGRASNPAAQAGGGYNAGSLPIAMTAGDKLTLAVQNTAVSGNGKVFGGDQFAEPSVIALLRVA